MHLLLSLFILNLFLLCRCSAKPNQRLLYVKRRREPKSLKYLKLLTSNRKPLPAVCGLRLKKPNVDLKLSNVNGQRARTNRMHKVKNLDLHGVVAIFRQNFVNFRGK